MLVPKRVEDPTAPELQENRLPHRMAAWAGLGAYTQVIVSPRHPILRSKLSSFPNRGIPPHKAGTEVTDYTIPAVSLPDGTHIMESKAIALALENLYPKSSAHLDSPVLKQVEEAWVAALRPLIPVFCPRMPWECLSGPSIEYYTEARKTTFGMSLDELEAEHGGEPAWARAMPGLQRFVDILRSDASGPFCLGRTPSYADFLIVGFLEWAKCVRGGCFDRVVGVDKAFQDVYDACEPWLKKND